MSLIEEIKQLRDDYRHREEIADDALSKLERRADPHNPDDYTRIKRLKTKHGVYRDFADELTIIIKNQTNQQK